MAQESNQSMDVDQSNDTNTNKPTKPEYELSVQLVMHNSPARCVVAIDDDTIVSAGRKDGEFILWKRMESATTNDDTNEDDDDDAKMQNTDTSNSFNGSFIFSTDKFHPLTFCAVKHKVKSDPARIVSGGSDRRAVVWDIDGNIIQQLSGHTNNVNSVDMTDDGGIITGSYDSTAKLWDADGQCTVTLTGHEHGVEVCSLESGEIVSGTFKSFHIWNANGTLSKTIEYAHDHMIRKIRRHPLGFLTCGNDGYVNLWSNKGECIRKTLAHPEHTDTPSFVYGLYCIPRSGNWISCGEDGTVKLFSLDGFLQQSLRHPGAVWDVSMLPNGDIITACADGAVRVWSADKERQADAAAVKEYYEMLQMTKQAQGAQRVNQSELEAFEVLNAPGKAGEFKMINDPKRGPSVYQWDANKKEWQYIGEIMGKPGAGDNKAQIDGISYDFVTQIDVNGDNVRVPLGFNKDDDPRQIARDFCVIHSIDLDLAYKIEQHLIPMVDPVARAKRVERERIAASKKLKHIPSFKKCGYEISGKMKLDAMKKKILQLNCSILNTDDEYKEFGVEDANDLSDIFGILADQTVWHVAQFPIYCIELIANKLLKWPTNKVLPILDMLRVLMLHQDAVDKLITRNATIRECIIGHLSSDEECTPPMQMIVSRLLSNYLAKRKRSKQERNENEYPQEILEFIQEALSLMSSAATNKKSSVHVAYIMLAHNALIWFAKFKVEECDLYLVVISAVFELFTDQKLKTNDKILYYALSLIGSCAWASNSAKQSITQ
eukprot:101351_1